MQLQMSIGGRWAPSGSGETMPLVSPATGETLGSVPRGSRGDVGLAVAAARKAQPAFARQTAFERSKLCHKIADVVASRREALARHLSLEQGKPYEAEALGEIDVVSKFFRMAAEDVIRLEGATIPTEDARKRILTMRTARGVYGVITPWNFPFAIPSEYLSAGLAAGNAIVWVPAPTTAGCAVRLMECLLEADVPPGIVNLVTGEGSEVGDEVAGHPGIDAIGFTGSSPIGLAVSRRAAGKPQLLELGGNSPTIIMPDADLERAARCTGQGAFWNAGQICDSTERILVHRSVHEPFVQSLVRIAGEFTLGNPLDSKTTLGPVHNARQAEHVARHINDATAKGARIVAGGLPRPGFPTAFYFPPTVIDAVRPEMLLNQEETFGPVAPVLAFDDEAEALAIANGGSTGLVASVFTRDIGRAFRIAEQLEAGIVNINEGPTYWQPHTPFGGYSGKKSGVGRLGGRHTLEEMTQTKCYVFDVG